MNSSEYVDELKAKWLLHRRQQDQANGIQIEENKLDKEWLEIQNMNTNNCNKDSLAFLEDIHIFALANLLSRSIIVISLESFRSIQPIFMRGIYLPLLRPAYQCVKDPIVIAYHNFHFTPLLFAFDEQEKEKEGEEEEHTYSERYFHFEKINSLLLEEGLTETAYRQRYKYDESERKGNTFYSILPLVYLNSNMSPMKVHFLSDKELKSQTNLIEDYLSVVCVKTSGSELWPNAASDDSKVVLLCCHLAKTSLKLKKNGLSIYLDFLNESMRDQETSQETKTLNDLYDFYCKTTKCTNPRMDDEKRFYGYCGDCFRLRFSNTLKQEQGQELSGSGSNNTANSRLSLRERKVS
jgi:hypothetical protein